MREASLFQRSERLTVPISRIAHPDDIAIFGTHFGDETYYADYAGIAARYGPRDILEIGVRFGYSGMALCYGARRFPGNESNEIAYIGLDAEYFGHEHTGAQEYKMYRSNAVASENFARFFAGEPVAADFFTVNTQAEALPEKVLARRYDLINIDGDHSYEGACRDIENTWPLLAPGGLMLIDDIGMVDVERAVHDQMARLDREGEQIAWQKYPNERMMILIQKGRE
jgi:predicted O-methyltransferase YrrM